MKMRSRTASWGTSISSSFRWIEAHGGHLAKPNRDPAAQRPTHADPQIVEHKKSHRHLLVSVGVISSERHPGGSLAARDGKLHCQRPLCARIEPERQAGIHGRDRGQIYGPDGAAALLGLKPTTLSSKVHRMGLKKDAGRRDS